MNSAFLRQSRFGLVAAVVLPLLAACSSDPGAGGDANGTTTAAAPAAGDEALATTTTSLDVDLDRLNVNLLSDKATLSADESLLVTVSMTNTASHRIRVLKWNTPVEGVNEPLFEVSRDGVAVDYVGRHYKRPAPRAKDYVILAPGETLTRTVDLADSYDLTTTGNYQVRFHAALPVAFAAEPQLAAELLSNDVAMLVAGRTSFLTQPKTTGEESVKAASYTGACTTSEKSALVTALSGAASYASGALTYLSGTPGSKPRYTTWFGAYTSTRWATAKTHYTKIKDALDNKAYVFDCACTDDYYAYVYPTQPYKVYLCNAFWSAPQTGTDSKAGTIVHETSHFNATASTDDHTYGQTSCKSLAKSSPTQALDNADSHEYFAENKPALN